MKPSSSSERQFAASLAGQAKRVLALNNQELFTKPSPKLYPHQWNWDSAFIALGLAKYNPERAQAELTSLLRGQWTDGMLPQIVFSPGVEGYFPGADYWQSWRAATAPGDVATSGITQPPMVTIAAVQVARQSGASFAGEVYPALFAYHRWLHTARDPYDHGLVAITHPWESGLDNSPRWIEPLARVEITTPLDYTRLDDTHIPADQRPSGADYDRFIHLVNLARDLDYEQEEVVATSPFLVQDVLFNSILYHADECLLELAGMTGESGEEIEDWMQAMREAFQTRLWSEADALYLDFDLRSGSTIRQNTIAALMPLFAGLPGKEQARLLVEKHLLNQEEYAPDGQRTSYFTPTTSKENPYFDPVRYWRGPIWANTNWLLFEGLRRYDEYHDLAGQIRSDTLELLDRNGFFEYFNPGTGKGLGTENFSWSAALALVLLDTE